MWRSARGTTFFFLACAAGPAACGGNGASGGGAAPPAQTALPDSFAAKEFRVGSGYRGLSWGVTRAAVEREHPDATPGQRDPAVLVRATTSVGRRVSEAFFFGAAGLEEVEITYLEKLSPQESASLAVSMDAMFGTHETSHADDHRYQFAWSGQDTDVRLTYDLRESVGYGPVVTYALRHEAPEASPTSTASAAATPVPATASPGARFAAAVRGARREGMELIGAESTPGKLTLVYGDATQAVEITLAADPKTGALVGDARLPRSATRAPSQRAAQSTLDVELTRGDPTRLIFGGKPGLEHVVTLHFGEHYVQLDPRAPNILAGASLNKPK